MFDIGYSAVPVLMHICYCKPGLPYALFSLHVLYTLQHVPGSSQYLSFCYPHHIWQRTMQAWCCRTLP